MILELLLVVPLAGVLAVWLLPKWAKQLALVTTLTNLGIGAYSLTLFSSVKDFQFTLQKTLGDIFGVPLSFHIGVDGISYAMVLLTLLLGLVSVLVSMREITEREPTYYRILLGLLAAVTAVFMSLDLVLFFIAWEIVLILMFLLILYWGHANRKYAAMKFLVYTGLASVGLLFAIIMIGSRAGSLSLLADVSGMTSGMRTLTFFLALAAFFVKLPVVPFHTWLPDAHVEAPTGGSILLAGVLLKMGAYGLIRFAAMFVDVVRQYQEFLFIMGAVTLIYGALVCLAQYHLKRLVAYSSVNHMGFVLLGVATMSPLGITGAVFEMVSHGLIAALLFGLAGAIHQVTGTFDLGRLGGMINELPRLGWLLLVAALAGMGLPTMTGFIAEFLVLLASFQAFGTTAVVLLAGVILTAAYMVRLMARTCFGTPRVTATDATVGLTPFVILTATTIVLGTLPFLLLAVIQASPLT